MYVSLSNRMCVHRLLLKCHMLFRRYVQLTFISATYENDNHMHHVTVTIRTMTYANSHDDTIEQHRNDKIDGGKCCMF